MAKPKVSSKEKVVVEIERFNVKGSEFPAQFKLKIKECNFGPTNIIILDDSDNYYGIGFPDEGDGATYTNELHESYPSAEEAEEIIAELKDDINLFVNEMLTCYWDDNILGTETFEVSAI